MASRRKMHHKTPRRDRRSGRTHLIQRWRTARGKAAAVRIRRALAKRGALSKTIVAELKLDQAVPRADIRGFDFRKTDLKSCDLSQMQLDYTNFSRADLRRADLHASSLRRSFLRQTRLTLARLTDCDLSECIFEKVNFADVDVTGAVWQSTILIDCDLSRAKGLNLKALRRAHIGRVPLMLMPDTGPMIGGHVREHTAEEQTPVKFLYRRVPRPEQIRAARSMLLRGVPVDQVRLSTKGKGRNRVHSKGERK